MITEWSKHKNSSTLPGEYFDIAMLERRLITVDVKARNGEL